MKGTVNYILGHSRRLNFIKRFNTRIKSYEEPVSAHSFYVTMYSFIIATLMKKNGRVIDVELTIKKALFHDLEESIAGDILTPFKKQFKKEYHALCDLAFKQITGGLDEGIKDEIEGYWSEAKIGLEGHVVDYCDDLAGAVYCIEQLNSGNQYFNDIFDDYLSRLKVKSDDPTLTKMTQELELRHKEILNAKGHISHPIS